MLAKGLIAAAFMLLATQHAMALPSDTLERVVSVLPLWPGHSRGGSGDPLADAPEGSGVSIGNGYIATAGHIVDRATEITVRLADGRLSDAEIVGIDRSTDIAVLRVKAVLPAFAYAPPPAPGGQVCAIGNQFGLDLSVTCGVVSAVNRAGIGFNDIEDFIQTDATINPGHSGGALVDRNGRLVGMISAIFTRDTDADIGVNFAISAQLLDRVTNDIITYGRVVRSTPGLRVVPLDDATRTRWAGVRVAGLAADTAQSSGLKVGDIITHIANRSVRSEADVISAFQLHRPGAKLRIDYVRDESAAFTTLTLSPCPPGLPDADRAACISTEDIAAEVSTTEVSRNADASVVARQMLAAACAEPSLSALATIIDNARPGSERTANIAGAPGHWEGTVVLANGAELRIERLFPGGQLRRVTVEYHGPVSDDGTHPELQIVGNADCTIIDARRLREEPESGDRILEHLAPDLATITHRESLNPPVPKGVDPGGVTVAHIDSGINYTLPLFADRLARDHAGVPLGRDYWDLDDRPFDVNPKANPFFPLHHGTTVASVLVNEAPNIRLLPMRYPDPDMSRMADAVAAAASAGAKVVAMPMGSNRPEDWTAYLEAARAHPEILFVLSAGNNGRDIDREPVYPASNGLANGLVVTSATPFGRLAVGSNWGVETVDLMVPAEKIAVTDHRGAPGTASGSSYAVPRIAALAARLSAIHPDWRAAELKQAILDRAHPSPYQKQRVTRHGWIANPADDL